MRSLFTLLLVFFGFVAAFGQNEQSPIVEKDIDYGDWNYKNVQTGEDTNLRKFAQGKKLVMVVYFAPWCGNWKHDVAFVQSMYDKYKGKGFDVIAVGEYDPVDSMKTHIGQYKLTFPVVWESEARTAKQTTLHYQYRRAAGDTRNWGSPWYVFLEVSKLEPTGAVLARKAPVVNGELIRPDAEKFIRQKLGLPADGAASATLGNNGNIEACEVDKKATALTIPVSKP